MILQKFKSTPGPWVIGYAAISCNILEILSGNDRVAELNAMGVRLDNDKLFANARLIAAAPELLEAAIAAVAALSQPALFPADAEAAKVWLNAAIAKARGQE